MGCMRKFIPNIITPEDASYLVGLTTNKSYRDILKKNPVLDHPVLGDIRGRIEETVSGSWDSPAYSRIEFNAIPHKWHKDTGSNNHMSWCTYGCSVLLTNKEEAGYLEYRDGHILYPDEHYCGLAIHSGDVEHRTVHSGGRVTYLAFLS